MYLLLYYCHGYSIYHNVTKCSNFNPHLPCLHSQPFPPSCPENEATSNSTLCPWVKKTDAKWCDQGEGETSSPLGQQHHQLSYSWCITFKDTIFNEKAIAGKLQELGRNMCNLYNSIINLKSKTTKTQWECLDLFLRKTHPNCWS